MRTLARRAIIWSGFGLLIVTAAVGHAQEHYAVLVGVGQYHNFARLMGPPNDVRLARDYLMNTEGFDEDNIFWLADDAPVAPERDNILNALEDLDSVVQEGDFVLLHFSGHGRKRATKSGAIGNETDGYDEIFLPSDAEADDAHSSGLSGIRQRLRPVERTDNAIIDNELGEFITSYRSKGCDVWLIMDVHGFSIDDYEYHEAQPGMFVAFFDEQAAEMLLPKHGADSQIRGILSHSVFTTLSHFPRVSYRQLGRLVADRYVSIGWLRSTPRFYGTHMDRVVFGGTSERPRLFPAEVVEDGSHLRIGAGTLRGFDVGARVAVHHHARGVDESQIGTGTVVAGSATESDTEVQWDDGAVASSGEPVWVRFIR